MQHSQQQMMEEICQLKTNKKKEKGSWHDPEHVVDKEETPVGGAPQNVGQRFITMVEVGRERGNEAWDTKKEIEKEAEQ